MRREYDAVVVGAGPAGAAAARRLAAAGCRVALVEARRLPRLKPCAGAVSAKALPLLGAAGVDLAEVGAEGLTSLTCRLDGTEGATARRAVPYAYTVRRDRLDLCLAERARAAGAEVIDGCRVTAVTEGGAAVAVECERGLLSAGAVVGADGALSAVRRSVGLPAPPRAGFAVEVDVPRAACGEVPPGAATIDCARWGYAWAFPRGAGVSVGIGTMRRRLAGAHRHLKRFFMQTFPHGAGLPAAARGCPLPMGSPRLPVGAGRVLLAGDAAGLVDAFSGEGIYYALWSGNAAAEALLDALAGRRPLSDYDLRLREELWPELALSAMLARLFYAGPAVVRRVALGEVAAVEAFLAVIAGEQRYRDFVRLLARLLPGAWLRRLVRRGG